MTEPVYLLFRKDGSGKFPVLRTAEGKTALLMFTCLELAEDFLRGRGRTQELQAIEYSGKTFVEWLHEASRRHGATEIALDPAPQASLKDMKLKAIATLLVDNDATHQDEATQLDKTATSLSIFPGPKKT